MEMILHRIIFDLCDSELYIRGSLNVSANGRLVVERGDSVSTDTYFNALPISFPQGSCICSS